MNVNVVLIAIGLDYTDEGRPYILSTSASELEFPRKRCVFADPYVAIEVLFAKHDLPDVEWIVPNLAGAEQNSLDRYEMDLYYTCFIPHRIKFQDTYWVPQPDHLHCPQIIHMVMNQL